MRRLKADSSFKFESFRTRSAHTQKFPASINQEIFEPNRHSQNVVVESACAIHPTEFIASISSKSAQWCRICLTTTIMLVHCLLVTSLQWPRSSMTQRTRALKQSTTHPHPLVLSVVSPIVWSIVPCGL